MKNYSEEKRIRPHILTAAVYLSVLVMTVYWMLAIRICGEKGAFFAVGPFFLYGCLYCSLVLAVQKAVYIMVRLRARRSQFHNAETNMQRSMRILEDVLKSSLRTWIEVLPCGHSTQNGKLSGTVHSFFC